MNNIKTRGVLLIGTLCTGWAVASLASAEDVVASDKPAETGELAEVVVTAERRTEDLQRVPVAVTAYSAEELTERNVRTTRDLILSTPNLQAATPIASDSGAIVFAIRGLSEARGGTGAQPAVGVYVDDVYYPSLHGALLRILDLDSVEVLRGPQGTLFGRNTIGGAIRYTTTAPSQEFGGHVEVSGGSYDRHDISGAVNLPLTDQLAVRLTSGLLNQGGFVTDEITGRKEGGERDKLVRLQLRYTPTADLTVDVSSEYSEEKFTGESYIVSQVDGFTPSGLGFAYNMGFLTTPPGMPPMPPAMQLNSSYNSSCRYCQPGTGSIDYSYSWANDDRITVAWAPSDALTVKSISAYFNNRNRNAIDLDRTILPIVQNVEGEAGEITYSQELQAGGAAYDRRVNWITGAYFYDYDDKEPRYSSIGGGPPAYGLNTMKTKSYALYAQGSLAVTDALTGTLGARASREEEFSFADNPPVAESAANTFNDVSPMGKIQYQWLPDFMTYFSVEKAFRGGGNNVQTELPPSIGLVPFAAEHVWSYEVGLRSQFLEKHLQLNATAFRANYSNIQLLHPFAPIPGSPLVPTLVENAGKGVIKGIELEMQAVIAQLRLHATLATLHAEYTELQDNDGVPPQGVTLATRFQHAPDFSYSIGGVYDQPLPVGKLLFNLDWGYQASQTSTQTNIDSQLLPSYGVLNGRIYYEYDKHWNVAFTITNMLNKYYFIGGANVSSILGAGYLEPGTPREFGGTLQYRF